MLYNPTLSRGAERRQPVNDGAHGDNTPARHVLEKLGVPVPFILSVDEFGVSVDSVLLEVSVALAVSEHAVRPDHPAV